MVKKLLFLNCLFLLVFILLGNALLLMAQNGDKEGKVEENGQTLAATVTFGDLLEEQITLIPTPNPKPAPQAKPVRNKTITVALLGDSMIQTMGEATYLKNLLENNRQDSYFKILNFGVGATGIEQGLERIPQVLSQNPEIIVVESFAYNHGGLSVSRHREVMEEMIREIKSNNKKVVLLATIAPNSQVYGQGIKDLVWDEAQRKEEAEKTKLFLQDTISVAHEQHLPLADAYSESLDANGEGKRIYIDPVTNLHPAEEGFQLISQKISQAISQIF